MSRSRDIENIYLQLPRFISEPDVRCSGQRYLPEVTRDFERDGVRFDFVIMPALILHPNDENEHYYPSERENIVESALREFAVEENPNFIKKDSALIFRLRYFAEQLADTSAETLYTIDEVELSLHVLSGTTYRLSNGSSEMYVRPIEFMNRVEENNEIYYCLRFSSLFLGDDEVFNYCFGDKNNNDSIRA